MGFYATKSVFLSFFEKRRKCTPLYMLNFIIYCTIVFSFLGPWAGNNLWIKIVQNLPILLTKKYKELY